jgi:putative sigma-54 modulation protein
MYASVDVLVDKLDRQVLKHKEKAGGHHREEGNLKRQVVEE